MDSPTARASTPQRGRARSNGFTGIGGPYQRAGAAELEMDIAQCSVDGVCRRILRRLEALGFVR